MEEIFLDTMGRIVAAIQLAGYDPYTQLSAFLRTQDERYITRRGNARKLINGLDLLRLARYVDEMHSQQQH